MKSIEELEGLMKRLFFLLLTAIIPQTLWAVGSAGYANQVLGTKAFGMGNSFAGLADDPSAVYFNPAGITQINNFSMSYGVTVEPLKIKFKPTNLAEEEMESLTPVVPHLYTVLPLRNKKWTFGFGVNSPFGLSTDWKDDSSLRFVATESKVTIVNFNPELAYKLNEQASFALGVVYGYVPEASLKSKVNNSGLELSLSNTLLALNEGNQELSGDGDGWGYNFGFLLKPTEKHGFGVSYRSEIREQVEGEVEINNITSPTGQIVFGGSSYKTGVKTELKQPQSLLLGYSFKPTTKWTFVSDAEWVDNKSIKETRLDYAETNPFRLQVLNANNPIPREWHATWNFGFGGNYKFNEMLEARAGYFHYAAVGPNSTFNPSIPEASRDGYTIGGSFNMKSFSIDLMYNYLKFDDRKINNDVGTNSGASVDGTYKTSANIFAATITHRFGSN